MTLNTNEAWKARRDYQTSQPLTLNKLFDAYEEGTGLIPSGHTADVLYATLNEGRTALSDYEWDRLPFQVRNLLDPGSVEPQDLGDWWDNRSELAFVASYMASHGEPASEVAYMVEKPWKYTDEYQAALAEFRADKDAEAERHGFIKPVHPPRAENQRPT